MATVKRTWADGNTPDDFLELDEAVARLQGYGHGPMTRDLLLEGATLRTPFAFYELAMTESEAPAMDGNR